MVTEIPKLVPSISRLNHKHGDAAVITCSVLSGSPPLKIQWFRDGQILQDSNQVKITSMDTVSTLQFKNLTIKERGSYVCRVSNTFGSDSSSTELIVEGKPVNISTNYNL